MWEGQRSIGRGEGGGAQMDGVSLKGKRFGHTWSCPGEGTCTSSTFGFTHSTQLREDIITFTVYLPIAIYGPKMYKVDFIMSAWDCMCQSGCCIKIIELSCIAVQCMTTQVYISNVYIDLLPIIEQSIIIKAHLYFNSPFLHLRNSWYTEETSTNLP